MCGIAGIINGGSPEALKRMCDVQAHRGPDGHGVQWFDDQGSGLAHRRLSIIDVSAAGNQPMVNAGGTRWITFNGEIYNYRELRRQLEQLGHQFHTNSDTEVLLAAYDQWGPDCVHRLNGMFAFGLYDTQTRELFLARDHLGVKPLYYTQAGSTLVFASEAKALFQAPGIERRPNPDAVISSLLLMWVPEPDSGFCDVLKLLPGHRAVFSQGRLKVEQYWQPPVPDPAAPQRTEAEYLEELCALLESAVRRQMVSDVPVGAFLSGGLDSSLVVALMRRVSNADIDTFTIELDGGDKRLEAMPDDAAYAQQVAGVFGTRHHVVRINPDVNTLLPKMLWHMDDPVADGAAINTYLIADAARNMGIPVLLGGAGADEVFGGYRLYLAMLLSARYRRVPRVLRRGLIEPLIRALPVSVGGRGVRSVRWARRFIAIGGQDTARAFAAASGYYTAPEFSALLQAPYNAAPFNDLYPVRRFLQEAAHVQDCHPVTMMTWVHTRLYLPGLNMLYPDRAGMAASVEVRPPLVDVELAEFAGRLPAQYKVKGRTLKYLLKRAGEVYLPHNIVHRPKAAFGTPIRSWMRGPLRQSMMQMLDPAGSVLDPYIRTSQALAMLDDHRAGKADYAHRLWAMHSLGLWLGQKA